MSVREPYTAEESAADIEAWEAASDQQRSEAFWRLRSIVSADAQLGDTYCAITLRRLAAERDRSTS
jgi:hypothetical protein